MTNMFLGACYGYLAGVIKTDATVFTWRKSHYPIIFSFLIVPVLPSLVDPQISSEKSVWMF